MFLKPWFQSLSSMTFFVAYTIDSPKGIWPIFIISEPWFYSFILSDIVFRYFMEVHPCSQKQEMNTG